MAKHPFQPLGGGNHLAKIDPGFKAGPLQHEHDVFGRHIAGRRGRKGAATYSAAAGIDDIDTGLHGGEHIGQRRPRVS